MARLTRVYHDAALKLEQEFCLNEVASHHLKNVLRVQSGQALMVFNGDGYEYHGHITQLNKQGVWVVLTNAVANSRESSLKIELAQGISRGERMDYAIQKAVELGVSCIQPLWTERCGVKLEPERLNKRMLHWQAVIINACEQSGRAVLPQLKSPIELDQWLVQSSEADIRLVCSPHGGAVLPQRSYTRVALLVGPEGGLSEAELNHAAAAGLYAWQIGPRILRTETAAVVALSLAQARWGDLG